jgi:hypothetical protein
MGKNQQESEKMNCFGPTVITNGIQIGTLESGAHSGSGAALRKLEQTGLVLKINKEYKRV